jgi:uncharacterized protein
MHIDDFIWSTEIVNKVASKHRVTQDEAEEIFFNNPKYRFVECDQHQAVVPNIPYQAS